MKIMLIRITTVFLLILAVFACTKHYQRNNIISAGVYYPSESSPAPKSTVINKPVMSNLDRIDGPNNVVPTAGQVKIQRIENPQQ